MSEVDQATAQVCPLSFPLTINTSGKIVPCPCIYTDIAIKNATRIVGKRERKREQGHNTNPFTEH